MCEGQLYSVVNVTVVPQEVLRVTKYMWNMSFECLECITRANGEERVVESPIVVDGQVLKEVHRANLLPRGHAGLQSR